MILEMLRKSMIESMNLNPFSICWHAMACTATSCRLLLDHLRATATHPLAEAMEDRRPRPRVLGGVDAVVALAKHEWVG